MQQPTDTRTSSDGLDDFRWLVSEEAKPWLERGAQARAGRDLENVHLGRQLVCKLPGDRRLLVAEQCRLRERARNKFRRADEMFFDRVALEQATDEYVAAYKAARFPQGAKIADLCCGIGGDLAALARHGPTSGIERSGMLAILARANCRVLGVPVTIHARRVVDDDVRNCDVWHVDPDRRPGGRRGVRLEHHEPDLEALEAWLRIQPNSAIKLAPAAVIPQAWQAEAELEWISRARECRQLVAWRGALAQAAGRRRATLVGDDGASIGTIQGDADIPCPCAKSFGRYVLEPDAAVIAARLTGSLANEHNLAAISPGVAYLTGDNSPADALLTAFEVEDVMPLDLKNLRRHFQARGIGLLEVKKRGVNVDPALLQRKLRGPGDERRTLLIMPTGAGTRGVIARRISG